MQPFNTELAYFIENQDNLVAKHEGQFLLIVGKAVVGAYPSALAAYLAGEARFERGTFMIQPCEPGPSAYTVTLASSEVFA